MSSGGSHIGYKDKKMYNNKVWFIQVNNIVMESEDSWPYKRLFSP